MNLISIGLYFYDNYMCKWRPRHGEVIRGDGKKLDLGNHIVLQSLLLLSAYNMAADTRFQLER